jgi:sec-independent protein translocase protein TatA
MGISIWQILLIVLVVVLLFGAGKLPRLMGDFAKGIKSFKTGMREGEAPPPPAQSATATAEAPQEPKVIESEPAPIEASAVKKDEAAKT